MTTREEWLLLAVQNMAGSLFKRQGKEVPTRLRVSCGFPAGRGAKNKEMIGQCWQPAASADDHYEIFISPKLDDGEEVLSTLAHEICHAVLPLGTGHKKPFKTLAYAIGLEGKATATVAGPAFKQYAADTLKILGQYPHGKLTAELSGVKKQSTRMVKCECTTCGYTVRTTKKWLAVGVPHCPNHGEMIAETGDEE